MALAEAALPDAELISAVLQRSPMFADVEGIDMDALSAMASLREFPRGHFILRQGYEVDHYCIIAKGVVRVFRHSNHGKDFTLAISRSGDTIGHLALFGDSPSSVSAQAVTNCLVIAFEREEFAQYVTQNPPLAMRASQRLVRRLQDLIDKSADLVTDKAETRIAKTLMALCYQFGGIVPFNHQQIADMAGLARETTSKVIECLAHMEIVSSFYSSIAILDKDRLRMICAGRKSAN